MVPKNWPKTFGAFEKPTSGAQNFFQTQQIWAAFHYAKTSGNFG